LAFFLQIADVVRSLFKFTSVLATSDAESLLIAGHTDHIFNRPVFETPVWYSACGSWVVGSLQLLVLCSQCCIIGRPWRWTKSAVRVWHP